MLVRQALKYFLKLTCDEVVSCCSLVDVHIHNAYFVTFQCHPMKSSVYCCDLTSRPQCSQNAHTEKDKGLWRHNMWHNAILSAMSLKQCIKTYILRCLRCIYFQFPPNWPSMLTALPLRTARCRNSACSWWLPYLDCTSDGLTVTYMVNVWSWLLQERKLKETRSYVDFFIASFENK